MQPQSSHVVPSGLLGFAGVFSQSACLGGGKGICPAFYYNSVAAVNKTLHRFGLLKKVQSTFSKREVRASLDKQVCPRAPSPPFCIKASSGCFLQTKSTKMVLHGRCATCFLSSKFQPLRRGHHSSPMSKTGSCEATADGFAGRFYEL